MGISIQQANSMTYFNNTNQILQQSSGYNSAVVSLQSDLTTLGYNTYGIDGYFGDNTKKAVIDFQKGNGLDDDGIAGPQTLGKINELINQAKASNVVGPKPIVTDSVSITGSLQIGSKGSAVKDLQEKLIRMGYDCGGYGADGDFGPGTYKSVLKFQYDYDLTQDGIVGPQTSQAIANALKTGNNGVPNYIMHKKSSSTTSTSTSTVVTNSTSTLQRGSKGSAVVELQKNLIKMGYDCGECGADGDFGPGTYTAVKNFQKDYGLTADGIVGSQTRQAIANAFKIGNNGVPNYITHKNSVSIAASIKPSSSTNVNLQRGSYGREVVDLQKTLIKMGYDCGNCGADGDFGPGTYTAVENFQKDYGLTVDGIVGSQTRQAIANALKTGNNGVPNYITHKKSASSTTPISPSISLDTPSAATGYTKTNLSKKMKDVYNGEVSKLQKDLTNLGYSTKGIDGYFGQNTEDAVKLFQSKHGLTVDGIAGVDTKNAIIEAINSGEKIDSHGTVITGEDNVTLDSILRNIGLGIKDTGVSTWQGLKSLTTLEGWENLAIMLTPMSQLNDEEYNKKLQMFQGISDSISSGYNEFTNGNWNVKSYYLSRVGSEIVLSLVGEKGAQYALKEIKLGKSAEAEAVFEKGGSKAGEIIGSIKGLKADEIKMVNDLVAKGDKVEIIPRSDVPGVQTPDFKVNGVVTELKTLNGTSLNTPVTRIEDGFQQGAEVVIIDGRKVGLTSEQANTILSRAAGKYSNQQLPGKVQIWTNEGIIEG